jgi:hypothetical protein
MSCIAYYLGKKAVLSIVPIEIEEPKISGEIEALLSAESMSAMRDKACWVRFLP